MRVVRDAAFGAAQAAANTDYPVEALTGTVMFTQALRLLQPLVIWQAQWIHTAFEAHVHCQQQQNLLESLLAAKRKKAWADGQLANAKQQKAHIQQQISLGKAQAAKNKTDKLVQRQLQALNGLNEQAEDKLREREAGVKSALEDLVKAAAEALDGCQLCKREAELAVAKAAAAEAGAGKSAAGPASENAPTAAEQHSSSDRSSSSSSSGSSSRAATRYSEFPVGWSDPYMMRRLLLDSLAFVNPTAHAWFKTNACACPHSIKKELWHMVTMSIARHLWAPNGPWTPESERKLALVLPLNARQPPVHADSALAWAQQQAQASYAHRLNVAFAETQLQLPHEKVLTAALLSMHALLALDPHGARVQPRQELLCYTPAGFHVAVCKTLMDGLQLPPQQQQQQQQQEQQMAEQQRQYWGQADFPAWFMWWHIGLLDYQQQQRHKQQRQQWRQQRQAAGRVPSSSSSSSSGSDRGACLTLAELYDSPDARCATHKYFSVPFMTA
jgi:hypothetical protein